MKKIIFIAAMLAALTVRAQEPTLPITIENQEMAWAMDWCSDHQFSETQYADFPSQHRRLKCNEVPYAAAGMLDVMWGKDGYDIRRLYGAVHSLSSNERVHRGHWHTYSPADQINIPPTIEKNIVPFTWSS